MSSLSRGGRPIGPVYNDLKREARKLNRQGYGKAAEELAFTASQQRLAGGGSSITSSESNMQEREGLETTQRGLMRGRRDVVLGGEAQDAGRTQAATGDTLTKRQGLYERMRGGVTPEMRQEAAGLGVTDSGFAQASASAGRNRLTRPAPVAGAAAPVVLGATPVAGAAPSLGTLTRPASDTALPTRETSPRTFAERDVVMKSAMAASADGSTSRTRQDAVDEANKARIAEGKIPFDDSIYGEMSKMDVARKTLEGNVSRLTTKAGTTLASRPGASPDGGVPIDEILDPVGGALSAARARRLKEEEDKKPR